VPRRSLFSRLLLRVAVSPSAIQAAGFQNSCPSDADGRPTKPTVKTYSSDNATTMPEVCRPRFREIFDFLTSGSSPDKNSMHFYLHERQKLCKYKQSCGYSTPPLPAMDSIKFASEGGTLHVTKSIRLCRRENGSRQKQIGSGTLPVLRSGPSDPCVAGAPRTTLVDTEGIAIRAS
jgi:hypothetical protein